MLIPAHTGAMVILSKHIPTIAQLKPGVVHVTKEDGSDADKFFVSGGYAFMHPDNTCSGKRESARRPSSVLRVIRVVLTFALQ